MFRIPLTALALVVGTAGPALAADSLERSLERDMKRMEEIARGAAEQLIGTMQQMLEQVPQYGVPEVLDNGDIIIRRKDRKAPEPREAPRRSDEPQRDDSTSI